MKHIDYDIIDDEAGNREKHEQKILGKDLLIFAVKSPEPVQHIIRGCSNCKTYGVCDIFVYPELFL